MVANLAHLTFVTGELLFMDFTFILGLSLCEITNFFFA